MVVKNWIYPSTSARHLKYLICKEIAYDYWIALEKAFNDETWSHLMELLWQLQSLWKYYMTMDKYISYTKDLINLLLAMLVDHE